MDIRKLFARSRDEAARNERDKVEQQSAGRGEGEMKVDEQERSFEQKVSHPLMASTMSSTQPAGNNQIVVGDCLTSTSSKYLEQSTLGRGSFGTVAKCVRVDDMKTVAIKMMRNGGWYDQQIKTEVATLTTLRMLDPDKCNIVRWYQAFNDMGHTCLVFEELDKSLYDFMCQRHFQPLPLKDIRTVVMQVATALNHLKAIGMIHADLKLENVMLVNHAQEPYRVKVIDFGLACNVSAQPGAYIQTLPYRSPEIILGLPCTQAIDLWSLGCIAAALYLGTLLYPGRCEYDMIRYIVETQGQPSDNLLSGGPNACYFFQRDNNSTTSHWKLKTPEQYHRETNISLMETRRIKLKSLDDLLHIRPTNPENHAERIQLHMFVDMLKGTLCLDPTKRLLPRQVLEYLCSNTWIDNAPQPLNHKSTHPSTSSQTQSYIGSGIKTKMTDGEDTGDQQRDSAHNTMPHDDRKRFRKSYASSSTSCSSGQTQSCVSSGIKRKMPHDEASDSDNRSGHETKRVRESDISRPICSSSNFSTHTTHVPDQMKRKIADSENVRHQQTESDPVETSHNDRRRVQKSYGSPSTSCSSSHTQKSISPGVKRKTPDPEDSDSDESSGHERKRVKVIKLELRPAAASHYIQTVRPVMSSPTERVHYSMCPASSSQTERPTDGGKY